MSKLHDGDLMKYLIFALLSIIASSAYAEGMDATYAKINGSCTASACPPGSIVKVTATSDDTSDALGSDGKSYPLTGLRDIKMRVIKQDEKCESCSVVSVPGGMQYSIDRPFLMRVK